MAALVSSKGKFIQEAPAKPDHDNISLSWSLPDPNLRVAGKTLQLLIPLWEQMELGQRGQKGVRRMWGALLGGGDGSHAGPMESWNGLEWKGT